MAGQTDNQTENQTEKPKSYDALMKGLWTHATDVFFPLLGLAGAEALEAVTLEPVAKAPDPRRISDVVWKVRHNGRLILLHVEFETSPNGKELPFRMAEYGCRHHFLHKLPVRSVVFLASSAGAMPSFYDVQVEESGLLYRFEVVKLYEKDALQLASDPMTAPFSLLGRKPSMAALQRSLEVVEAQAEAGAISPEKSKNALLALLMLATFYFEPKGIKNMFADHAELMQHPLLREQFEEGEAKGEAKGMAKMIRRTLAKRLPRASFNLDGLEARSLPQLEEICDAAALAKDDAAFRTAFQKITGASC